VNSFSDRGVYEVFDFSSCEAGRHLSESLGRNFVAPSNLVQVELEYVLSSVDVGMGNVDFLVKPAWPGGGLVK
jgi:hypothetical protein